MLKNILDVDWAAQKISVKSRIGAILLFDFSAAFPSLSHDLIWDTLEYAGGDPAYIDVVKLLYRNNWHLLKIGGSTYNGIQVNSGVRQGCPLSGLLFAICIDVFLLKIQRVLRRDECVGAFADDIAVVLGDFWLSAPALQRIFVEFHEISALALNARLH